MVSFKEQGLPWQKTEVHIVSVSDKKTYCLCGVSQHHGRGEKGGYDVCGYPHSYKNVKSNCVVQVESLKEEGLLIPP